MTDNEVFKQWLNDVLGLIWGTPNLAKKALEKEMKYAMLKKPKRTRGEDRRKDDRASAQI